MSPAAEVEKCLPLCQLRRTEASSAGSPGLTFGLRTRVHSLAPLRDQLSRRNAGNGGKPAKSIPASSQLASKGAATKRRAAVGGNRGFKSLPCPAQERSVTLWSAQAQLCAFLLCSLQTGRPAENAPLPVASLLLVNTLELGHRKALWTV